MKTLFLWKMESQHKDTVLQSGDARSGEPSVHQAVENMHPIARSFYRKSNYSKSLGYYETLSQMLKKFTPRSWKASSMEERIKEVPELFYWNDKNLDSLERDFFAVFS